MDELLQPIQSGASTEGTGKNHLVTSPMQSTLDPLTEVEQLLYLGKLPAAVHLAQDVTASPTFAPRACLLLVRCLLLQGRFRQAESICKTALDTLSTEYEEAMSLYARSIAVLNERKDPQASAIIANTFELQGQTAMTCGYPSDASRYLEQAMHMYSALNMALEVAIASNLLGLVFYNLGNQGYPDLYTQAAGYFEQALHFFQSRNMRDMSWKSRIYLTLTSFHRGRLALTADEQQRFWHYAAQCLEEAGTDVDLVRGHFIEVDQVAAQTARLGLVADKEKVYVTAIQLHYHYLHDSINAFNWLERLKGRAFLDALALTGLHPPGVLDKTLLDRENHLVTALYHATTQTEVVDLNEQLHAIWDKLSANSDPAVTEYVMLRRGEPVGWRELVPVLQMREDSY